MWVPSLFSRNEDGLMVMWFGGFPKVIRAPYSTRVLYRVEEGDFPDFLACRDLEDFKPFRHILVQARYLPLRIEDKIPLLELIPNEESVVY